MEITYIVVEKLAKQIKISIRSQRLVSIKTQINHKQIIGVLDAY